MPQPAAQVPGDRRDLLPPHALDGGDHALAILVGDLAMDASSVSNAAGSEAAVIGRRSCVRQRPHGHRLDLVDDAALGQRIQTLQRLRLLGGPQTQNAPEQELVGARGKALQRRH